MLLQKTSNAILSRKDFSRKNIVSRLVYTDQINILVPQNNPLAEKKSLLPQDLDGYSFAVSNLDSPDIHQLYTMLETEGIKTDFVSFNNVNYLFSQAEHIQHLMVGDSLFTKFASVPGRVFLPLEGEAYQIPYYISYLKINEPRILPFIHYLEQTINGETLSQNENT